MGVDSGVLRYCQRRFQPGFAGQGEDAESAGIVGHGGVGVDAVAHHRNLVRAQAVTVADAAQHRRVGLSEYDVGSASGGVLDAFLQRSAVHQHGGQVGRADPVGIGRYVRDALTGPPGGPAKPGIHQGRVEGDNQHVRHIGRIVGAGFESGFLKLCHHARRAQHEKPPGLRMRFLDIVNGGE